MTTKAELLKVIKLQCQECFGSEDARKGILQTGAIVDEIRQCTAPTCPLFPYRLGKDPRPSKSRVKTGHTLASHSQHRVRGKAEFSTIGTQ